MSRVYSSEWGKLCPKCEKPIKQCRCQQVADQKQRGDGKVRVRREMKGRGGKTVTVIVGLPLTGSELKALASELKRRFGTGGAVKADSIEIQGDYADACVDLLKEKGHAAKRAGG